MEEIRKQMAKIEDPRHQSYVKYALADILILILCGVLCGLDTLEDLVVYAKSAGDFLRETFGMETIPSKATFGRVLSAVDGKAICSTEKDGNSHKALQILSAYMTDSGITLAQETIHEKTNEIPETCRRVVRKKGGYVFGLKENQPPLLEDVRLFWEDGVNCTEWENCETTGKNAG